jgi:hypothetical protein
MKKLVLLLLLPFIGFGQSVSAPDSKSFLLNTSGQDASGFVISGFESSSTLLASISLVEYPAGTSFNLTTTSGLTSASGFTLPGNKVRLVVTGTMLDINNALSSLKVSTGSVSGNVRLSVAVTVNPVGFFYNGVNGHFYRPIATGTSYTGARQAAANTTFKGQQGYLVTITTPDEDSFVFNNVPQFNIWFALTDEVVEGRWVIDAGPERGTLIKTSNGQFSGNIQGQYNNWAPGEPNNAGNEDYAVTKWNGSQWNDLPNNFFNPYVIEYGTWTNPDDATFTEFYTNSVTHTNGDVLTARFNFDFGNNVDETRFSVRATTFNNNIWSPTNGTLRPISGLGKVDITNDLDGVRINEGWKAITTPGQVEWSIINPYEPALGGHRLQIDEREFFGTGINLNTIRSIKLFDIYDGPIQVLDFNGWWKQWIIPGNITDKILASSFQSSLRLQNGWYGIRAEYTFSQSNVFRPHGIEVSANNQTELNNLYNNIITVSDVFIAFKELSNSGLFGNESGNEFTSGIQFMNADVDNNGIFNEADTFRLLQHLTGGQSLIQSTTLPNLMKLYNKSDYDNITKLNWNTQSNSTRNLFPFNLNTGVLNNTYNVSVTWVGDVNLSHSARQSTNTTISKFASLSTNSVPNQISAYLLGEIVNGKVIITISVDPLQQELVGTQFNLNYDDTILKFEKVEFTTKGNPTNFGTNRGSTVSLGSIIMNGAGTLDKTTEYKVIFTPNIALDNILGLTSISNTDAVSKSGVQLKVKIN